MIQEREWFKYLDYWCNRKVPIGSGLSIPFLIGIELMTNEDYDIKKFLSEIKNIKIDHQVICLRYCKYINEIVCCLDCMSENELKYYNNFDNIYFSLTDFNNIKDYQKFENEFIEKYSDIIKNKYFSKENGNWIPFTANVINEIKMQLC